MKVSKIVLFISLLIIVLHLFADVPQLINYQGKLTAPDGVAISRPVEITFRFYASPTDDVVLWEETHDEVHINRGLFDVVLGGIVPFDSLSALDFSDPYWLELTVDGETLSPRQSFSSVPYALNSMYSDTATYVRHGGISGGIDNYIARFDGSSSVEASDIFQNDDENVGIGVTSIDSRNKLEVLGNGETGERAIVAVSSISGAEGWLGTQYYGAYGNFDSYNYGYLGASGYGVYATGTEHAGYFEGNVDVVGGDLTVGDTYRLYVDNISAEGEDTGVRFLSDINTYGNVIKNEHSTAMGGHVAFEDNIIPVDGTYDIGTIDNPWDDVYVGPNSQLFINEDPGDPGDFLAVNSTGQIRWVSPFVYEDNQTDVEVPLSDITDFTVIDGETNVHGALDDLDEQVEANIGAIVTLGEDLLDHELNDHDMDATNELITDVEYTHSSYSLAVTEAGVTHTTNLFALDNSADIADVRADLDDHIADDGDLDDTNELITAASFNSMTNTLTYIEDGVSWSVDLSDLNSDADITAIEARVTTNETDIDNLETSIDTHVSTDSDMDDTNELNTSLVFNAATENIEMTDAGGTLTADLSSFVNDADLAGIEARVTSNETDITALETGLADHIAVDADIDETNELNTGFTFDETTNELTLTDAGGAMTLDLSSLEESGAGIQNLTQVLSVGNTTDDIPITDDTDGIVEIDDNLEVTEGNVLFTNNIDAVGTATNVSFEKDINLNGNAIENTDELYFGGDVVFNDDIVSVNPSQDIGKEAHRWDDIYVGDNTVININGDAGEPGEILAISPEGFVHWVEDTVSDDDDDPTNELQNLTIPVTSGPGLVVDGSGTMDMEISIESGPASIIPVSTGAMNINLNSDMVDGLHGDDIALRNHLVDGDTTTSPISWDDMVDLPSGLSDGVDDVDDADHDPSNEVITAANYNPTTHNLRISEAGFNWDINLVELSSEGVYEIGSGYGIEVSPDPIVTTGEVSLAYSGVTAGTYNTATITVDAYGRVLDAVDGDIVTLWEEGSDGTGNYIRPVDTPTIQIYTSGSKEGKIDALYVDPVFQIENKQYSTWMYEGIGMRIDVVGELQLTDKGELTVDLAQQPEGSDLWLFWRTVAENSIIPFVTPQEEANLMAKIDGSKFYIKSVNGIKNAKFSYRLSGKRLDEAQTPSEELNRRKDPTASFINLDEYDRKGNKIDK